MKKNRTKEAIDILKANWTGNFTKSASNHYPHQSNWDTGFNCIGNTHISIDRVIKEYTYLFKGQWKNGMLPHMVFDSPSGQAVEEEDFWNCEQAFNAPEQVGTSGITHPPIHGFILWKIFQEHRDNERFVLFLKEIFPKLIASHEYLYNERDTTGDGLITIKHPWESGMDDSPIWDEVLRSINFDNRSLADLIKSSNYDDTPITEHFPFQIIDPLFNSTLVWSNECLIEMGIELDLPTNDLFISNENTVHSMNEFLWDGDEGCFAAYNVITRQKIPILTHSSFMPLIAGIPDIDQVLEMVKVLFGSKFRQHGHYSVPSNNLTHKSFKNSKFWRGPVWISTNWLLIQGLLRYDLEDLAMIIMDDSIDLVEKYGFHQFFDPDKQAELNGYGAPEFSGSASLYWDLIREQEAIHS